MFSCESGFMRIENEVFFRLGVGFVNGTVNGVEKRGRERRVIAARTTRLLEKVWMGVIPQIHRVFGWEKVSEFWRERVENEGI